MAMQTIWDSFQTMEGIYQLKLYYNTHSGQQRALRVVQQEGDGIATIGAE